MSRTVVIPTTGGTSRAAVAVAASGAFLAFLDATIVNIAFPALSASFAEASRSELSWVLDAYFVVIAALLVPAGGVADRIGVRRAFVWSVAAFGITSLLCALAPTWQLLVAARVLQAASAACIAPTSLTLVIRAFAPEKRTSATTIWGASAALAAAIGPTLGGALVEVTDWRWIFLINAPLCLVIVLLARGRLPETTPSSDGLPDLLGALLVAVALGALTLGIVEGPTWGWLSAGTLGVWGLAVVAGAVVLRRQRTHPRPVVPRGLGSAQGYLVGNLGTFVFSMAFFATILGNVLFLTSVWGYSALEAGAASAPGPIVTTLVGAVAARLVARAGFGPLIAAGAVLYAAGILVLRSAGPTPDYVGTWLPGMMLCGLAIGLAYPTLGSAAVAAVDAAHLATASAVNAAYRQVGAALGTALLVVIVGSPTTLAGALSASDDAYLFSAGCALLAAVVALPLGLRGRETRTADAATPTVEPV